MPPLPPGGYYPTFKRWLSDYVFYIAPSLMLLALSIRHLSLTLPTAADPALEAGGLWGESKAQGLSLFGPGAAGFLAPCVEFRREATDTEEALGKALEVLSTAGIDFPIVAKPDRGYQGWGVRALRDAEDLRDYLDKVSPGVEMLLQKMIAYGGETGIFYVRNPGESRGRICSMALTYAPHVFGDGRRTLAELVEADGVLRKNAPVYRERNAASWEAVVPEGEVFVLTNARSARLGAVYRDSTDLVTPALEDAIEAIAREVPEFHFGRFDIRFRSLEELWEGRGFIVVELNGAGAEMLHLWDGRKGLIDAYRTLWWQYRTLFSIASAMRRRGHRPTGLRTMIRLQRKQEQLRKLYPPSY